MLSLFGLYAYEMTYKNSNKRKCGVIVAYDMFYARLKLQGKRSTRKMLNKYGRYDCKLTRLLHI